MQYSILIEANYRSEEKQRLAVRLHELVLGEPCFSLSLSPSLWKAPYLKALEINKPSAEV